MPDGTATFDGMFHQMELDCKKKREEGPSAAVAAVADTEEGWSRQCRQEYGSALYMTPEEKQISFYNRYFIFRKNRNINAKQLKNSFLSYAGLQEEQDRASAGGEGEDEGSASSIALEKIAKASRPIDVASKPAIAAHILEQQKSEKMLAELSGESAVASSAKSSTLKIKPKPKKASGTATTAKAKATAAPEIEEAPSAPIAQIEKKIQKRTKKAKATAGEDASAAGATVAAAASAPPAAKPKRQTKKKTDL
jgi:hypothetical protein